MITYIDNIDSYYVHCSLMLICEIYILIRQTHLYSTTIPDYSCFINAIIKTTKSYNFNNF